MLKEWFLTMNSETKFKLQKLANNFRIQILNSIYKAGSGHPGGSLSCVDLLTYLYFEKLNVSPQTIKKPDRDRFVLSKGHAAPALYAVLAGRGFFDESELHHLRELGAILQGHPNMKTTLGVEMSTGSLGQGISTACGMALGVKLNKFNSKVVCLMGDGELEEGQVYEAFMFASHYKLDNLCVFVDNNGLQIDGSIEEVAGLCNISDKFLAFGFDVVEIDGHDFIEIEQAFEQFERTTKKPFAVVMKTVKGKGVSFMENEAMWHGTAPTQQQLTQALAELKVKNVY